MHFADVAFLGRFVQSYVPQKPLNITLWPFTENVCGLLVQKFGFDLQDIFGRRNLGILATCLFD